MGGTVLMKSKIINILIADDNKAFTAVLSAFLRRDSRFKVVSVSHDGEEALKQIRLKKPDVIILDIVMPYLDGIEVLERLKNMIAGYNPGIIVFSAVGQDKYTSRALDLGADYYFIKPFDMTLLSSRIKELYEKKQIEKIVYSQQEIETVLEEVKNLSLVDKIMYDLGLPKRLKGYIYIIEAAEMIYENPEVKKKYTTDIYPNIAAKHNTKPENVERAIRNIIEVAYKSNFRDSVKYFDFNIDGDLIKPSNGKLLELISDTLKERGNSIDDSND